MSEDKQLYESVGKAMDDLRERQERTEKSGGGKEKKSEAKGFVDKALQSDDPYFKSWAEDLNKKLK